MRKGPEEEVRVKGSVGVEFYESLFNSISNSEDIRVGEDG